MEDKTGQLVDRLLDKAQEQFLLAVELYNRPTIRFHAESCAVFLCQAWELMLKAHLIKTQGEGKIYYKGSDRTLSLEECLRRVFTNRHDPLRHNMRLLVQLRNTSTHFITEEHEFIYAPILQACVENFADKLEEFHSVDISERMPKDYLRLAVRRSHFDEESVRAKYDAATAVELLKSYNAVISDEHIENTRYAAQYVTRLVQVKNPKKADLAVRVDNTANVGLAIVKQLVEPKNRYPYTPKMVISQVNKKLEKESIQFASRGEDPARFNLYHWRLFVKAYAFKDDERYSYDRSADGESNKNYVYSEQAIELIVESIKHNPSGIVQALKDKVKEEHAPGAKDSKR